VTAIRIDNFSGIAPRWSARLLQQNQAQVAENAKLLSGELRGFCQPTVLYDFNPLELGYNIARAFRLPASVGAPIPIGDSDTWVGFPDPGVDFIRSPVLEDSFERYYWTGDDSLTPFGGAPAYNTRARIDAGDPAWILGIPTPVDAPIIVAPPGPASTSETRAYVYTFVSAYGEEGAPSPPTIATGNVIGTWAISGMDASVPNPTWYNLEFTRIYRTVGGTYFHVADVAFGTTTFNDTAPDTSVALNYTLSSLYYTPPPTTLQGIVAHPGGFLVGFSGRDLWMSQPYLPHAWPVTNILTCQTDIVGLAIFNNCILVMTTSHPYFAEGMNPANVTLQKLDSIDPCVSRRSIATTVNGVYYASPQGLILNTGGMTQLITRNLFTFQEWQDFFSPTTINAVPYGVEYVAFDTTATGFVFSPTDSSEPLAQLDAFSNVATIQQDAYSGQAYLVTNNQIQLWDPLNTTPIGYTWQSKQFDLPKPVNFSAMRLKFNSGIQPISPAELQIYIDYNEQRIQLPLSPINSYPINGVRTLAYPGFTNPAGYSPPPEIRNPIGGSELFNLAQLENITAGATVVIQARDLMSSAWITVFSGLLTTERIYRLPAGIKSDGWMVTLIGNTNVYSFAMAETGKELQSV
jgi:hypothetical protein